MATSRFSIPEIDDSRDLLDGPGDINDALNAIDGAMTGYSSGTSLPSPATAGKLFYRTDTGILYFDTGAAWLPVSPDANAAVYRTVSESLFTFTSTDTGATTYWANGQTDAMAIGATGGFAPVTFPLTTTDFAVAGLTTRYRVQGAIVTNGSAPAVNFTYSVARVTNLNGTASVIGISGTSSTLGGVTRSTPGANSAFEDASASDFTISTSGTYVLLVTTSGTPAAGSCTGVRLRLQVRNTA